MGIMMLALSKGTEATLIANGPDENIVVEDICKLVEDYFWDEKDNSLLGAAFPIIYPDDKDLGINLKEEYHCFFRKG